MSRLYRERLCQCKKGSSAELRRMAPSSLLMSARGIKCRKKAEKRLTFWN